MLKARPSQHCIRWTGRYGEKGGGEFVQAARKPKL